MISVKRTLAFFAILVMISTIFVPSQQDVSSAETEGFHIGTAKNINVTSNSVSFEIPIQNNDAREVELTLTIKEGDNEVYKRDLHVPATWSDWSGFNVITIRAQTGSHTYTVHAEALAIEREGEGEEEHEVTTPIDVVNSDKIIISVNVPPSFWSGWVPYVVLIIAAIIISIVVFLWYRDRPKKQSITFNDLEAGKQPIPVEQPIVTEKKTYQAADTGRIKYVSDRRNK